MAQGERRGLWFAAIGAVAGVVAVAVAVPTLYLQFKDRPADSKVQDCREAHHAPVSPPTLSAAPSPEELAAWDHKVWADCAWPPPPGADKDGFWQVEVDRVHTGESTAELITADLFKASCPTLAIRYQHTQQGIVASWDFVVANDQIVDMKFQGPEDRPELVPAVLPPGIESQTGPRQTGLTILAPANIGLARTACRAESSP
jgi:hypothetical protein